MWNIFGNEKEPTRVPTASPVISTHTLTKEVDRQVQRIAPEDNIWALLEGVAPWVGFVHAPTGLILEIVGAMGVMQGKSSQLSEHAMPDDWVQKVAAWPDASPQGVAFLAKKLTKNGLVSVSDALEWAKREQSFQEEVLAEKKKKARIENVRSQPGAKALLERASTLDKSFMEPEVYERVVKTLTVMVDQGTKSMEIASQLGSSAINGVSSTVGLASRLGTDAIQSTMTGVESVKGLIPSSFKGLLGGQADKGKAEAPIEPRVPLKGEGEFVRPKIEPKSTK